MNVEVDKFVIMELGFDNSCYIEIMLFFVRPVGS